MLKSKEIGANDAVNSTNNIFKRKRATKKVYCPTYLEISNIEKRYH